MGDEENKRFDCWPKPDRVEYLGDDVEMMPLSQTKVLRQKILRSVVAEGDGGRIIIAMSLFGEGSGEETRRADTYSEARKLVKGQGLSLKAEEELINNIRPPIFS